MPAALIRNEAIAKLAAEVNHPEILRVLLRLRSAGFMLNGRDIDKDTAAILQRLVDLGLVDPGYVGPTDGSPFQWVSNSNGERVLRYLTGIRAAPHYEILSSQLAQWLEQQGTDRWWNVDGDPLLTARLTFPCPADELATEVRRINGILLVQAKNDDIDAKGQLIDASRLEKAVSRFAENIQVSGAKPEWASDRLLYLCWKGSPHEWLLTEDTVTTAENRADEAAKAK